MIRRRSARQWLFVAAMCSVGAARAGIWGSQPVVGIAGDYSSNPALLNIPDTAENHVALLLDAPTTYTGDAFKFTVLPSFRLSDSKGYSTLDSDYEHLNASIELDTELSTFTVTGAAARDSSLYHDFLISGSTGVQRDLLTGDAVWDHHFTERADLATDVNTVHVSYGASTGGLGLSDYKYTSLSPTLGWSASETSKLTLALSAGRYDSTDGTTESSNLNSQLGFVKQLNDIWTVTASAGYSHATNKIDTYEEELVFTADGPEIVLIPVRLKSSQNGTVYAASVTRKTERLSVAASASRQLVPSGFAFLSLEKIVEFSVGFTPTERLTLNADVRHVDYSQPSAGAPSDQQSTVYQLTAGWQWTERWKVTASATRVTEHYGSPGIGIDNNGFSLELSRLFNFKTFQ